jgi:hypothetical protein
MGSSHAEAIYFVRVTDDADRFGAEGLINSNYMKGHNVYLLNAKPGRYVAVGCAFPPMGLGAGPSGIAVFSKAAILQTEVEVTAGSTTFMGDIEAVISMKTKEADEAEAHYLRMIDPTSASQGPLAHAIAGHPDYTATFTSFERGETATTKFWNDATEKHFKNDPAWATRIASRSAPPVGAATESPSAPKQP